jgi:hypothetical protein
MGAIVGILQLVANLLLPGIGGLIVNAVFSIAKSLGIFSILVFIPIFYMIHFIAPLMIGITFAITLLISLKFSSVYHFFKDEEGKLGIKGFLKAWLMTHAIAVACSSTIMSVLIYIFIQVA